MTIRLHTFGNVFLTKDGELLSGPAGQRRLLSILTVLAASGEGGVSRDKLLGLLWAEGDPEKTRHALTQSLYHIRKALGVERIFLSGTELRLNAREISSDIGDFQRALNEGRLEDAVEQFRGPFLDGFYLNGGPEFECWVSAERDRVFRLVGNAIRTLAVQAAAREDTADEMRWSVRLAEHDPLDGAATAHLMTLLMESGDRAAALQRARTHEARMRQELELPPNAAVAAIIAELRRPEVVASESAVPARAESPVAEACAPTDAATSAPMPPAPTVTAARVPRWNAAVWTAAAASIVAAGMLARLDVTRAATARAETQATTIMVAPFSIDATDPSTAYLREGLLDLLTTRIADADTKRATDPARVLRAWRTAGYDADSALSVSATARIARELNAGEVVMGSVRNSDIGVTVHASLVDAMTNRVKAASDVHGSPDSLIVLTDRIISALILKEAGDRLGTLPSIGTASPLGLRAYLVGRSAYRRADYYGALRAHEQALAQDPNFALAALGLAMAADRANSAEQHDRGLAVAWARQSELSAADRAYLRAFAGPRYPEPSSASEALAAWEQVVRVAPDRAEGWYELGESFYYDADVLGMRNGPTRAGDAFRHALQLDPAFAPARRTLTLLLARQADTLGLRRLMADGAAPDTADVMRAFVRWRAANALGDGRELERVRRTFDGAPNAALRAIAMTSQFDGVAIDDGDRALEILRRRPLSDAEALDVALARHSRALNSGDYASALAITNDIGVRQPSLHAELRIRVLDALYSNGDRTAAVNAVRQMSDLVARPLTATRADSAVRLADVCVIGQWRLFVHDTAGARRELRRLRAGSVPRFPVPVGANPNTCAELLDASLAIADRRPAGRDRLAHLDSLMLSGPAVADAMRYANLVVAREYQSIGEPARAMAALQRRSYMRGWPRYRATGLQLLAQLATQVGDTATARSALRRLAATRRRPITAPTPTPIVSRIRSFSRRLVH